MVLSCKSEKRLVLEIKNLKSLLNAVKIIFSTNRHLQIKLDFVWDIINSKNSVHITTHAS